MISQSALDELGLDIVQRNIFSNAYNEFEKVFFEETTSDIYKKEIRAIEVFENLFILNQNQIYEDSEVVHDMVNVHSFPSLDGLKEWLWNCLDNGYYDSDYDNPVVTIYNLYSAYDYVKGVFFTSRDLYPEINFADEEVFHNKKDFFLLKVALNLWVKAGRSVPSEYLHLIDNNIEMLDKNIDKVQKKDDDVNDFDFLEI